MWKTLFEIIKESKGLFSVGGAFWISLTTVIFLAIKFLLERFGNLPPMPVPKSNTPLTRSEVLINILLFLFIMLSLFAFYKILLQ